LHGIPNFSASRRTYVAPICPGEQAWLRSTSGSKICRFAS
jgi:hypothetical protein